MVKVKGIKLLVVIHFSANEDGFKQKKGTN